MNTIHDYYPAVEAWNLPSAAFRLSLDEMANDGRVGREGVALWLGVRRDQAAHVTHVVRLRGPHVTKRRDLLQIGADLMNEVADLAIELNVQLVGQIHSHGPHHGVDLSPTDLRYGITVPGYLSVVAPGFCLNAETTIEDCGVHVCGSDFRFRRIGKGDIPRRVILSQHATVPLLTVGEN